MKDSWGQIIGGVTFWVIVFVIFRSCSSAEGGNSALSANSDLTKLLNDAYALVEKQQYEQAESTYLKAVKNYPNSPDVHLAMGSFYYNLKNYGAALTSYDQAIKVGLNTSHVFRYRGDAYRKLGQDENAINDYNDAITIVPIDPLAYYFRAVIYDQRNSAKAAFNDYVSYLKHDQTDNDFARYSCERVNDLEWSSTDFLSALLTNTCDRFAGQYVAEPAQDTSCSCKYSTMRTDLDGTTYPTYTCSNSDGQSWDSFEESC